MGQQQDMTDDEILTFLTEAKPLPKVLVFDLDGMLFVALISRRNNYVMSLLNTISFGIVVVLYFIISIATLWFPELYQILHPH